MIKNIETYYSENFEEELCYEKGNNNKYIVRDVTTEFLISKINEIIDGLNKIEVKELLEILDKEDKHD